MGVQVSQSLRMREAWGPCRRRGSGSRTLGTHAEVPSGHPAEGVHIYLYKEGELQRWGGVWCFRSVYERRTSSLHLPSCAWCSQPWLPSSLPAPAWGGAGKGEQLLLMSASLSGSWAPVLPFTSSSSGDLR